MIKPSDFQECNTHACITTSCLPSNGCQSRYVACCGTSIDCTSDWTLVWDGPPASALTNGNRWTWSTSCPYGTNGRPEGVLFQGRISNCSQNQNKDINGYRYNWNPWCGNQGGGGGGYQRKNCCVTRRPL